MKKLIIAAIIFMGLGTAATAQKTAPVTTTTTPATKMHVVKKTAPAKVVPVKTTTAATPIKADGTPDMRYKANKGTKTAVAGPKKKDGTADMRYKANKATPAKATPPVKKGQ